MCLRNASRGQLTYLHPLECCWPYRWCCLFLIQQTSGLPWRWPLKDLAGLSTTGHTPLDTPPSSCLDLCCTSDWHSRLLHWWAVSSFWLSVPLCPNGVVSLAPVPQVLSCETRAVLQKLQCAHRACKCYRYMYMCMYCLFGWCGRAWTGGSTMTLMGPSPLIFALKR